MGHQVQRAGIKKSAAPSAREETSVSSYCAALSPRHGEVRGCAWNALVTRGDVSADSRPEVRSEATSPSDGGATAVTRRIGSRAAKHRVSSCGSWFVQRSARKHIIGKGNGTLKPPGGL
mmetsp:Transcript_48468/g.110069  ORF Transcript_48468/g.110069 Transcript_48468/m.110069 type:complete len:119 (+) Transcript_48468:202-558(+)